MDQFDPKDEPTELRALSETPSDRPQSLPPPTPSNFYKEFVQFAIFVGVVLVPVYISYSYLVDSLQGFVAQHIVPYNSPDSLTPGHTVDSGLARLAIFSTLFLIFSNLFFIRHALRRRANRRGGRSPTNDADIQPNGGDKEKEVRELRQRLQTNMAHLRIIHNQMYRNETPRLDYVMEENRYYVDVGGDLFVDKELIVRADDRDVQFWKFFACGDEYSAPADSIDDIDLSVIALDETTKLLPVTVSDKEKYKEVAVYFLPLLEPGESRSFRIHYRWKGSLLGLIELGEATFTWNNRSSASENIGKFSCRWTFHECYGEVACEITGKRPQGVGLQRIESKHRTIWQFGGDQVPTSNIQYELRFNLREDVRQELANQGPLQV